MAIVSVNGILYERVDTTENWESVNPVLGNKEKGFERASDGTPIGWKMGNGATPWNLLGYWDTVSGVFVSLVISAQSSFTYNLSPSEISAVNAIGRYPNFVGIVNGQQFFDIYPTYTGSPGSFTAIVVTTNTNSANTTVQFS